MPALRRRHHLLAARRRTSRRWGSDDGDGAGLSLDAIAEQVAAEPKAELIAERVAAVLGVGDPVACAPEETFWAVRKLLEALASRRPLVVVFDDLHWAEPTFLDLIEHIGDYSRGCPIFMLCLARPELLDERPGWSGGKLNATSLLLEPLSYDECAQLIANLRGPTPLPAKSEARIAEAADGNPLFAEELLAMVVDETRIGGSDGDRVSDEGSRLSLPPTIQALLSARLELLPDDERAVFELASVEGTQFHRGALGELAPGRSEVSLDRTLSALLRRDLDPPRSGDIRRGAGVSIPACADPRRRLRIAAEGRARRVARTLRRLARAHGGNPAA